MTHYSRQSLLYYHFDEVGEEEKPEIEAHLVMCEDCCKQLDEIKASNPRGKHIEKLSTVKYRLAELKEILQSGHGLKEGDPVCALWLDLSGHAPISGMIISIRDLIKMRDDFTIIIDQVEQIGYDISSEDDE